MLNDLGCLISATGRAFPDHTIITCFDALQEEAQCATVDAPSVRLLLSENNVDEMAAAVARSRLLLKKTLLHYA